MNKVTIRNENITALVDLDEGMNVLSINYNGIDVIELDEKRRDSGATYSVPLLFPTPNRTRDNFYIYNGKRVDTINHGYARKAPFELLDNNASSISAKAIFDSILLEEKIELIGKTIKWSFRIANNGFEEFPFSLALHPFFKKSVFRTLTCSNLLEVEAVDKLPTGKLLECNQYNDRLIDSIDEDTVYYSDNPIKATLKSDEVSLIINGSNEFKHLVIFTSPEKSFICVEPQTGSTDFVNLHNKGYVKEAALIALKSKECKELSILFDLE